MSRQRKAALAGFALLTIVFITAAAFAFFNGRLLGREERSIEPLPLGEVPAALRMQVTESGVVAINAEQFDQSFLPIEHVSPDNVSITRNGEQVPFYVDGEGEDATLYFYATAITNSLESPAVYWLSPGQGVGMVEKNAAPSGPLSQKGTLSKRWEENDVFLAQADGSDVWFGQLLFAPSRLEIPLGDLGPVDGPGQLTVRIWSNNQASEYPDHHVILQLNDMQMAETYWDGIGEETLAVTIPEGLLKEEANVLTLIAPGDTGAAGEALYLDWIALNYQGELEMQDGYLVFENTDSNITVSGVEDDALVFDITDPSQPEVLTGGLYRNGEVRFAGNDAGSVFLVLNQDGIVQPRINIVPERTLLSAPDRGADYIAIVADVEGFSSALEPLLEYRRGQGLSVELISADQIYDEFGYGRAAPEAIRDFISYATVNWDPAPRFALLVGDASYDLHNFTGGSNPNLLPTYLVYTEHAGYVASDTWFALSDEDSLTPSLALGRFPAQTPEQLKVMVEKTLAYERASGSWQDRALLVADDEPDFDAASEDLASSLGDKGFSAQKLYMSENENIHDSIVSALNQGVGIINYIGHGSIEVWGDERVFQAQDAQFLINGDRLPIFTTFTCLNGYFNHPDVDALAETLILAEAGGVAAAIAPSGRSLTSQQLPLAEAFYERMLSGQAGTLGEALQMAKEAGADYANLSDVIHTFNLLGDPALGFHLPSVSPD